MSNDRAVKLTRGALAQKILNIHCCTPYNLKELWKSWIPEQVLTRARKQRPKDPTRTPEDPRSPPRTPPAAPKPPQEHPNQAPNPPRSPQTNPRAPKPCRQTAEQGEARHRMHTKRMSAAAQKQFRVPKATKRCRKGAPREATNDPETERTSVGLGIWTLTKPAQAWPKRTICRLE